jgi:hypothetical protein
VVAVSLYCLGTSPSKKGVNEKLGSLSHHLTGSTSPGAGREVGVGWELLEVRWLNTDWSLGQK